MLTNKTAEWFAIILFCVLVIIVFQQIDTSMTEQGIASGSPYDNAAAYPKAVAILMGLLILPNIFSTLTSKKDGLGVTWRNALRPLGLLVIFALYLFALGTLGYHLSTPPMLVSILMLAGHKNLLSASLYGLGISLLFAFLFEVFLKIVLPGGIWALNIPW